MAIWNAREAVYDQLRRRIITMELKPGDPLNDRLLAEEMGISRTPVREALIMLNIAHMVTIKPQSGTYVAPMDLERMEIEQFARFCTEKEMLNRICGRLTPAQVEDWRSIIEDYRIYDANPESAARNTELLRLDNRFHRWPFEVCGMEKYYDQMVATFQHIERLRMFSLMRGDNSYVCGDHMSILEAVAENDPVKLAEKMNIHLNRYVTSVEEARVSHPEYFVDER